MAETSNKILAGTSVVLLISDGVSEWNISTNPIGKTDHFGFAF